MDDIKLKTIVTARIIKIRKGETKPYEIIEKSIKGEDDGTDRCGSDRPCRSNNG